MLLGVCDAVEKLCIMHLDVLNAVQDEHAGILAVEMLL